MAPPPPIDLLSSCIMNNVPGNDGFMQEKQGSTVETEFEVKAESRRDRFFSTVGFGIVSTMYHHTALMTEILSEMKDPRPIIVTERTDTDYRYTVPPTTVNRLTASRPTVNRPTVNRPYLNRPTVNRPYLNRPTVNPPTVNRPTVYQTTVYHSTVNQFTVNRPTVNQSTICQSTVKQPICQSTLNRPTVCHSTVNQSTLCQSTASQPTVLPSAMHRPTSTVILRKFFPHFSHPPYNHLLQCLCSNSAVGA
jgi:hypothetical protein